jgi:hypothetical protein
VGAYALVAGGKLLGTFPTWAAACNAGYAEVGTGVPFLVKLIEEGVTVHVFHNRIMCGCAEPMRPKTGSIIETLELVRRAGGDAWDRIKDPDGYIAWMRGG